MHSLVHDAGLISYKCGVIPPLWSSTTWIGSCLAVTFILRPRKEIVHHPQTYNRGPTFRRSREGRTFTRLNHATCHGNSHTVPLARRRLYPDCLPLRSNHSTGCEVGTVASSTSAGYEGYVVICVPLTPADLEAETPGQPTNPIAEPDLLPGSSADELTICFTSWQTGSSSFVESRSVASTLVLQTKP